jgi:hypothetical protein
MWRALDARPILREELATLKELIAPLERREHGE